MKIFHRIVSFILLITTPALIAYPSETPIVVRHSHYQPLVIPDLRTLSYDEMVHLLRKIESDQLDRRTSAEELDQINQVISLLALEGATEQEKPLIASDISSLFRNDDVQYALLTDLETNYAPEAAIYTEDAEDVVLCRHWLKNQWKQTRRFVRKHKKAIVIGTIIVVTVAVVVVAAVAISSSAAGVAAATGGALASDSPSVPHLSSKAQPESIVSSLQTEVSTFKETVAQEQFAAVSPGGGISMEENGRIIGSLFAHKVVDSVTTNLAQNPLSLTELKEYGLSSGYPMPGWANQGRSTPHSSADLAFSTDTLSSYPRNFGDLNAMSYQVRGDLALNSQCYTQAVQDFGNAISLNPANPVLYLERGIAHFELGNYEQSIADYHQFVEKKAEPFSATDFTVGFAKGVPKGAYDSGKGALLFLSEFVTHPVQTSKQVFDSLTQLAALVKNDELGVVAEALSPELHQLITQWETLPSETRGELAGYAVGKLGTDLLAPGAAAKIANKSVSTAKELVAVCKNLQIAQETLVLETAAGIGVPVKVGEIVEMGKKTINLGEELGFSAQEIGQLQKAGKLEKAVSSSYEHLTPTARESFELFNKAQQFLKPYKGFMSESQARELIHHTGIQTFPRPSGIPESFRIQISDRGAGMKYVHPNHTHTSIRIMPGKPHSPFPHQQKPYVIHMKDGKCFDKFGNTLLNGEAPEAHIPYNEFVYRD